MIINGFGFLEFWELFTVGLLGLALVMFAARMNPKDARVTGTPFEALKNNWDSMAFAVVAHLIVSTILWDGAPMLHFVPQHRPIPFIISGACSQFVVLYGLQAVIRKIKMKANGAATPDGK